MTKLKFVCAAAVLSAAAIAPGTAQARGYSHGYGVPDLHYGLPYPISYSHNYGPGLVAGSFAYYDGPSTNACAQGAATYFGQDRRRYPCY